MRAPNVAAGISASLALLSLFAAPACAGTTTTACEANPTFNAPAMTLVHEGEAAGMLTITAPFGEMSLPATIETREGRDENGEPLSATGIRAAGPATVQMPDTASRA